MDLSQLNFPAEGITVQIFLGDLPADVLTEPEFPSFIPEDAVVVVVRHWGRFISRLIFKREDSRGDANLELIQLALDACAKDGDGPTGPKLVP